MPLYVADYIADTAHLSAAESGAYLHLLMHYWAKGGLPDDDRLLSRIARMTPEQWAEAKPLIQDFFYDGWRHKRVDDELERTEEISTKRKAAAELRHSKSNASASANAEQKHTHASVIVSVSKEPEEKKKKDKPKNSELETAFREVESAYPKRKGGNGGKVPFERYAAAIKAGIPHGDIVGGARRFAAEQRSMGREGTEFVPMLAVWLNQERWRDFPEQPKAESLLLNTPKREGVFVEQDSPEWGAWALHFRGQGKLMVPALHRKNGRDGAYLPAPTPNLATQAAQLTQQGEAA